MNNGNNGNNDNDKTRSESAEAGFADDPPFLLLPAVRQNTSHPTTTTSNKHSRSSQFQSDDKEDNNNKTHQDNNNIHHHKGLIFFFHGWAQNKAVARFHGKNLWKKLGKAGHDVCLLEAPHRLPLTSTVEIQDDDGVVQAVTITNGRRPNARAWFTYDAKDAANAERALTGEAMAYQGLGESLAVTERVMRRVLKTYNGDCKDDKQNNEEDGDQEEEEQQYSNPQRDDDGCSSTTNKEIETTTAATTRQPPPPFVVTAMGFSQGAVFCHILATLAAQGHDVFGRIDKFIFVSGFAARHNVPIPRRMIPCGKHDPEADSDNDDGLYYKPPTAALMNDENKNTRLLLPSPSLHIIGTQDTSVPPALSQELADQFDQPQVWRHAKGHVLPTHQTVRQVVFKFLEQTRGMS